MIQRPFLPAWLDDAGLSTAEFRVYCHLCRSADNATGIAWPSYDRIADIAGISRSTVHRCLKALEVRHKLIEKTRKPFGGSCRYRVLAMVSPEARLIDANGVTRGTNKNTPIVSPENRNRISHDTPIVSPEAREGTPKKVLQRRVSNSMVESIWNLTPKMGKERSSKKQLKNALKKLPVDISEQTILKALEAWTKSESWTADSGKYVSGIHTWIHNRKWECVPEPATPKYKHGFTIKDIAPL